MNNFSSTVIKSTVVCITPDIASVLLKGNIQNRPVNKQLVSAYAKFMRAGEWMVNGEAIILDADGNVLDGQHRLLAIILSNMDVDCLVTVGVDASTFSTMNTGRRRRVADVLGIAGEVNATSLAAAIRAWCRMQGENVSSAQRSSFHSLEVLKSVPELRHWVSRYSACRNARAIFPSGLAAVLAAMSRRHGDSIADKFMIDLAEGANLKKGSPALALRDRFTTVSRGHRIGFDMGLALIIKAAKAYAYGKSVTLLRWTPQEDMPNVN